MKHFLRLLFIGAVLFVLLGLFRQSQDGGDYGRLAPSGLEQVIPGSGILTLQQDLPCPVSFNKDSSPLGFALQSHCHSQKNFHSLHSKQELLRSHCIYKEIKPDLLLRTGVRRYESSREEIES